jgi:regulator of sirC expression with transglutaminase-like and TPR domain
MVNEESVKSEELLAHPRAKALLDKALRNDPPRLDLAALALALLERPELEIARSLFLLDALAEQVLSVPGVHEGPLESLHALRRVLGDQEKFRGNPHDAGTPEHSFLDRVLETRVGLPISLSVVYLEVARRAGIALYGVSFPGHFVVAANIGQGKVVLDPYHGGNLLTESGCADLLQRVAPQLKFHPSMLRPATPKTIVYRMLSNLKRQYLRTNDGTRALRVVDLMLRLSPDHPGELRARAAILSTLGAYRAALADIERCLEISPDAPDHENLLITAKALRQRVEFLN